MLADRAVQLVSNSKMPTTLTDPARHLLEQLEANSARHIIGLAGLPGSGKSTFAACLADEINAHMAPATMVALGMDGFHFSQAQLRQFPDPDAAFARRGAPWTFDADALRQRLQRLRDGAGRDGAGRDGAGRDGAGRDGAGREAVAWPGFEHEIGDPIEAAQTVAPATRLVLVEGLYLLHRADGWAPVGALFDERWFLDTPWEVARERLARRHQSSWNLSRQEADARIEGNDGHNAALVLADRDAADYWIAG